MRFFLKYLFCNQHFWKMNILESACGVALRKKCMNWRDLYTQIFQICRFFKGFPPQTDARNYEGYQHTGSICKLILMWFFFFTRSIYMNMSKNHYGKNFKVIADNHSLNSKEYFHYFLCCSFSIIFSLRSFHQLSPEIALLYNAGWIP